jgi:TetR/AcrR family tetracycline transcriptional repressor
MNREEKGARDRRRLEEARRRTQERLEWQRKRVEQQFDRMQQRLDRKYGATTDTQQRIIDAALEVLKQGGLVHLTQRKLATMLDMQAPALYWHFKNKEVLVDYMAEAILQREFADLRPRTADEPWQDWLTVTMMRLRRAMLAFPDGARVVAGAHLYPAVTLAQFSDTCIASLRSAGMGLREAYDVVLTATHYTFGHVIEEQAAPTPDQISEHDIEAFLEPYPTLAASIAELDVRTADPDVLYKKGLGYIIAGAGYTGE